MSNTQPPPGHPRQPMSYPRPSSYQPAGMPHAAHYAYPPQGLPPNDPYRPAPTSLPSMRTLDHQQQQQQQQHALPIASHMAGSMPPSQMAMGYYGVHPGAYTIHPDPNAMRFAIAPGMSHDPRIALSGGRHKKEIKRRTKTGCLTCRKRRIKCDEAHPTCGNCKKSKRECLGYDPIFKQQQGPAAIQPALNSQSSAPPLATTLASTPIVLSSTTQSYQPIILQNSYAPSLPPSITFGSPVSSTPQSVKTDTGFDFSTAIDPALQGPDASSTVGTPASQYQQSKSEGTDQDISAKTQLRAKKMKVDELIALGGALPPIPRSPASVGVLGEITNLYNDIYVPGLTMFFETQWYRLGSAQTSASKTPEAMLHANEPLIALFATFLDNISGIKSTDPADMVYAGHLETCLVWALASLPSSYMPKVDDRPFPDSIPPEDDLWEARARLHVFETLVSNTTVSRNPLFPASGSDNSSTRKSEFEFWHHLGQYLLQSHSSSSESDASFREHYLGLMRSLLDGRENRDVLYSIAVLREYTLHWDASLNEEAVPTHLEESDPRSKLAVATRFIREESTSAGGTTNVVRRFSDIAYRAFVRPGVNVNRT
ncbi:hypothetical protein B0T26DRAFT_776982 [Lasiosphaeria miniovina]|uniref:Zn(2)-C6 fungal-type domain-containing protein n=1 Tax=Lasiosphaeria miniovina TaxID=1954250 RepID=A0AA40AL68_9PEZI|nr:uncharacterized protein B0T26DRAFT_776982 [Lasiosphaeria miniovina]KAK0717883.1 hypothetical protein B0T26DRAFT_776982 [Lasiosphaeria miniovina]